MYMHTYTHYIMLYANSAGMHAFTCMHMHVHVPCTCICVFCIHTCYKFYTRAIARGYDHVLGFNMTFPGLLQKVAVYWQAM